MEADADAADTWRWMYPTSETGSPQLDPLDDVLFLTWLAVAVILLAIAKGG